MNPTIFRAYDIRGVAFTDFDEDGFYRIGVGYAGYIAHKHNLDCPKIFVSGDGRLSMAELFPAFLSGLRAGGANVTWGGILATPMNYFALHQGDYDATVQISASHNPPEYNGLKFTDREGAVSGDELQEVRKRAECAACDRGIDFGACVNECQRVSYAEKYTLKLHEVAARPRKLFHLVLDAGNGVAGMFYPAIVRSFGYKVDELYCDLDAHFPNHQPDPERTENMQSLITQVQESGADFGIGYDGDGDRLGVVLSDGTLLSADKILAVITGNFLKRNPGAKVILDAMSSAALFEKIQFMGGEPILCMTGHSHIEHALKEHGALLGGEQSGHIMFGENFYGHDDACLATLRFLQAVEEQPELLDMVTSGWPKLYEFSEKMTVDDTEKFAIVERIQLAVQKLYPEASTLDGVRVDYGNGEWSIIRASNTAPKIAIRIEASSPESLAMKKDELLKVFEAAVA